MKLTLKNTKIFDDKKLEIYEIANYTVKVVMHNYGWKNITVRENKKEYLPTIRCRGDIEGNILGFEIETTSYGSLPAEEIEKIIAGLREATEVAAVLTKKFADK